MSGYNGAPNCGPAPEECRCPCHSGAAFMHAFPCCEGRCPACVRHFKAGLAQHCRACGGEPECASVAARPPSPRP